MGFASFILYCGSIHFIKINKVRFLYKIFFYFYVLYIRDVVLFCRSILYKIIAFVGRVIVTSSTFCTVSVFGRLKMYHIL